MTGNTLFEAVSYITHDLVEKASAALESKTKKYRNRLFAKRISVSAVSCACAVLLLFGTLSGVFVYTFSPKYDGRFSSLEINLTLPSYNSSEVCYEQVILPKGESPKTKLVPKKNYAFVYKYNSAEYWEAVYGGNNFNSEECRSFAEKCIPEISKALGIDVPDYTISDMEVLDTGDIRSPRTEELLFEGGSMHIIQTIIANYAYVDIENKGDVPVFTLYGNQYNIDVTKDEDSIKEDIFAFLPALNRMFGEKFNKIQLKKNEYGEEYADTPYTSVRAFLYRQTELDFDYGDKILWDKIQLDIIFTPSTNTYSISVRYNDYRLPMEDIYENLGVSKRVSLKEAQELLKKGYSFGAHSWQGLNGKDILDFSDYDYVSYEYCFDPSGMRNYMWTLSSDIPIIPFYVFYKLIESSSSEDIYAKAYVPAVPVGDMEDYFSKGSATLKQSDIDEILEHAKIIAFDIYTDHASYLGDTVCEDPFYSMENQAEHVDETVPKHRTFTIFGKEYSCEYSRTRCYIHIKESYVPLHIYLFDGGFITVNSLTDEIEMFYYEPAKQSGQIFQSQWEYKSVVEAKNRLVKELFPDMYSYELEKALENSKNQKEYTDNLARINSFYDWITIKMNKNGEIIEISVDHNFRASLADSETKTNHTAFLSESAKQRVLEKAQEICDNSQIPNAEKLVELSMEIDPSNSQIVLLEDGSYGVFHHVRITYLYKLDNGVYNSVYRSIGIILK